MGFQDLVFPLAGSEHSQQALLVKDLWIPAINLEVLLQLAQ